MHLGSMPLRNSIELLLCAITTHIVLTVTKCVVQRVIFTHCHGDAKANGRSHWSLQGFIGSSDKLLFTSTVTSITGSHGIRNSALLVRCAQIVRLPPGHRHGWSDAHTCLSLEATVPLPRLQESQCYSPGRRNHAWPCTGLV